MIREIIVRVVYTIDQIHDYHNCLIAVLTTFQTTQHFILWKMMTATAGFLLYFQWLQHLSLFSQYLPFSSSKRGEIYDRSFNALISTRMCKEKHKRYYTFNFEEMRGNKEREMNR